MPEGIIFRTDDAGSCVSADRAILEAVRAGVVRNVSVMAPGPSIEHAAELLKDESDVEFGVHLTLNAEWDHVKWGPVSKPERVPSLLDENGHFTAKPADLNERGFDVDDAVREAYAQITRLRLLGLRPTYFDEHMGVGWIGELADALDEVCKKEGLIRATGRDVELKRLPEGDTLLERAKSAKGGAFLYVTHPGMDAPDMRAMGHEGYPPEKVIAERDGDRRDLTDPALIEAIATGQVRSLRYSEVLGV